MSTAFNVPLTERPTDERFAWLFVYLDFNEVWLADVDKVCVGINLFVVPTVDYGQSVHCPLTLSKRIQEGPLLTFIPTICSIILCCHSSLSQLDMHVCYLLVLSCLTQKKKLIYIKFTGFQTIGTRKLSLKYYLSYWGVVSKNK